YHVRVVIKFHPSTARRQFGAHGCTSRCASTSHLTARPDPRQTGHRLGNARVSRVLGKINLREHILIYWGDISVYFDLSNFKNFREYLRSLRGVAATARPAVCQNPLKSSSISIRRYGRIGTSRSSPAISGISPPWESATSVTMPTKAKTVRPTA